MAKSKAGTGLPDNMKNKGVPKVKSSSDMTKEIEEVKSDISLIEAISNQGEEGSDDENVSNDKRGGDSEGSGDSDGKSEANTEGFVSESFNVDGSELGGNVDSKEIDGKYKSNAKISPIFAKKLAKKEDKPKKKKTMIYLEDCAMSQFKTLSRQSGYSLTKLFEMACMEYIKGQEIDEVLVKEFDDINAGKGKSKGSASNEAK